MQSTKKAAWGIPLVMGAVAAGVLQSGACLSMTDGVANESEGLVADSLTGTWLVSVDTANLAPFEVVLSVAPDGSDSPRLSGASRIPEFATRMGMNLVRSSALEVTLAPSNLIIRGLAVRDRPVKVVGYR